MKKNIVQNTMALFLLAIFVGCGAPTYNVEKPLSSMDELKEDLDKDDQLAIMMSVGIIEMEDKDWLNGKTAQEIISYSKEIIELGKKKEQFEKEARVTCINNLKKIGDAFWDYDNDNKDRMPHQVPVAEGGVAEIVEIVFTEQQPDPDWFNDNNGSPVLVNLHQPFKALGKYLDGNTKVLVCPSDRSAVVAKDWDSIIDQNVSYKFSRIAANTKPNNFLSLCKHHAAWVPPKSRIVDPVGKSWHILLSDSSVRQASFSTLNKLWMNQSIKNISPLKSRKTPKVPKEKHSEYCKTVLKQLDGTKEMWATQEGKADGGTPTKFVIDGYFEAGFPICPANGIYDLKTVGEKTQCSEHGSN
jgi:hypothetical protein